jgi:hypothetical protein
LSYIDVFPLTAIVAATLAPITFMLLRAQRAAGALPAWLSRGTVKRA